MGESSAFRIAVPARDSTEPELFHSPGRTDGDDHDE
jgi:hypothetical protein